MNSCCQAKFQTALIFDGASRNEVYSGDQRNQPERILPKDWEELKELEQRLIKPGIKEGGAAEDWSRAPSTAADGPGALQATQPPGQATSPADTCRAGTTTPFAFGETLTPDLANNVGN
jgi:hypothetical protein